jgi:MFS family permease
MTAGTDRPDRLFTPAFIALALSEFAYFLVGGLLIGVTPFFVTGPVGSDDAGVGLVFGAFGITTLALRPFAGRLADRRGRRPMLLAGALLMSAVVLGHALTTDLALVIGLRLLYGVAEALYFVAAIAALADLAPPGRAGEALSYNSLSLYLGVALGPLAGEVLLEAGGFGAAWAGGLALGLLAFALALRVPETGTRRDIVADAPAAPLIHRAAVGPGLGLFAGVAAMSGFFVLAGRHAERQGLDAWSLTFLLFGGLVVGLRVVFAKLPDRVPPLRLGSAALACSALGLAVTALVPGIEGLVVGTVGLAIGIAFMTPALFAAIFGRVIAAERGAAAGTATLFIDLGFTGGPFLIGLISGQLGFTVAFGAAALIALAGCLVLVLAIRRSAARQPLVGDPA